MSVPVITAATSSLGSSGMGSIMTVLAEGFIRSMRNKGRILKYCNTRPSEVNVAHGTARMLLAPDSANITITNTTDGSSPTTAYDSTVGTFKDVSLNQHVYTAFGYSEIARALDQGRALEPLTQARMYALFNYIEADVASLASTFSTNIFGTHFTPLTETVYDQARTSLINAKVPDGEALHAFYAPGTNSWVAMTNLANFHEYRILGVESPHIKPDFGTDASGGIWFKSAYHHESQNVKEYSGSIDSAYNFLFHRDAILVAMTEMQLPTSPGVEAANFYDEDSGIAFQIKRYYDFITDADVLRIDSLYGKGIGRDSWGAILLS